MKGAPGISRGARGSLSGAVCRAGPARAAGPAAGLFEEAVEPAQKSCRKSGLIQIFRYGTLVMEHSMIQFYFLSIILNGLSGYTLIQNANDDFISPETGFRFSIHNETFRLVLGAATIITGLLKLLSCIKGDVPVVGDIIPALAGFLSGFVLVFEFYRDHSSLEPEHTDKIEQVLIHNKKWVGCFALIAAFLHFLLARVLFL
jgi:hypothetical protein